MVAVMLEVTNPQQNCILFITTAAFRLHVTNCYKFRKIQSSVILTHRLLTRNYANQKQGKNDLLHKGK